MHPTIKHSPCGLPLFVTLIVAAVFILPACSDFPGGGLATRSQQIIYGADDRVEAHAVELGSVQRGALASTGAVVPLSRVTVESSGSLSLDAQLLSERLSVCPDERFAQQISAADCSSVLVEEQRVVTAGHCISELNCQEVGIVFGYQLAPDDTLAPLSSEQLYRCAAVEQYSFGSGGDYAVVRLDRPVTDVEPAPMRAGRLPLEDGSPLFIAGYPSGLPLKLAAGAQVVDSRPSERDFFRANLDSFPGNSGGGVFDETSGELLGLIVRGPNPGYELDDADGCYRPERAADDAPVLIESIYIHHPRDAHCASSPNSSVCHCGDGLCSESQGETTRTCAEDCGSSCGDGECNGGESGDSCYVDCGSCGDNICESKEVAEQSCAADCGCRPGLALRDDRCVPVLGNLNGDPHVDERDVSLLQKALARPAVRLHQVAADVDCNGQLNQQDVDALLAGVSTGSLFPCEQVGGAALGSTHSCAFTNTGQLRCWGQNRRGRLGIADDSKALISAANQSVSVGHEQSSSIDLSAATPSIVQISAGPTHSCALSEGGQVYCFGDGGLGQLGHGNREDLGDDESVFAAGPVPLARSATSIAVGGTHSCAILSDGSVSCWGANSWGQLGYGTPLDVGGESTPASVPPLSFPEPARSLALGFDHSCALLESGKVHCWGANFFGQLGRGTPLAGGPLERADSTPPLQFELPIAQVNAFGLSTCVVDQQGRAFCFGENLSAQLGYGHRDFIGDDELPADAGPVGLPTTALRVKLGAMHACALLVDGGVTCWGSNLRGELGLGHALPLPPGTLPSQVPPLALPEGASQIFVGAHHSCALLAGGSMTCWGDNTEGQLGAGMLEEDQGPLNVELRPEGSSLWEFEDESGLSLWTRVEGSSRRGVKLAFFVEAAGTVPMTDLRAYYSVDHREAPGSQLQLFEVSTPTSSPELHFETNGISTLEFDFDSLALAPGCSSKRARRPERFRLRFSECTDDFRWENDPGAMAIPTSTSWHPARGFTLVNENNQVLYGWSRPTDYTVD